MLNRRLIIVGGKGGVGRTTVSAALAIAFAKMGRKTLVAHVRCERCERQLGRLLGASRVDDEIRQVNQNLWAVNMTPQAAIREMGLMVLRFRSIYRAVLENRIVKSFLRALPALDDYSMIGKAWYHTTETLDTGKHRFDSVIFDGPATGHLVSMLRIPQVILDSVPEGPLTADARRAQELLTDPKLAAMVIVTLAEEMPVSETIDLFQITKNDLNIHVENIIVNQLYPQDINRDKLHKLFNEPAAQPLHCLIQATKMIEERSTLNEHYREKLASRIALPQIHLPHLFQPNLSREDIEPLVEELIKGIKKRNNI